MNGFNSRRIRKGLLTLIDIIIIAGVSVITSLVFFAYIRGFSVSEAIIHALVLIICIITARLVAGVYRVTWRFSSEMNYLLLILADTAGGICYWAVERLVVDRLAPDIRIPLAYMMLNVMFVLLATSGMRLIYQMFNCNRLYVTREYEQHSIENAVTEKVAVIGGGVKAVLLADMLRQSISPKYEVCCFMSDDDQLIGSTLRGAKIYPLDKSSAKMAAAQGVTSAIIAYSELTQADKSKIFKCFSGTEMRVRIYESPFEIADGEGEHIKHHRVRDMRIEDLLFRDVISVADGAVTKYYSGKTVLITGAGGSIGSELCRQVAALDPKKLIMLDIYENNVYSIQQELIMKYEGRLNMSVEIASIRDAEKLDRLFERYRPEIVINAAAHKHVPLMEDCADEAVKNNVFGTLNMVNAAEKYNVRKFIVISTDKAVNPTNIMGASKRMCEMIVQSRRQSPTDFMAVRFGNVLGSNGSVVPLFKLQIENGGPVTVTDRRITRYFMTIPEAAQLVLEAGAEAAKGEIYVLDMGNPVKIWELAENMIRLAGLRPYKDIDITEIGLRPGEKLYEELLTDNKALVRTDNDKIFIENGEEITTEQLEGKLAILRAALDGGDMREALHQTVPTYIENGDDRQ